jgi:hypothetical protein
VTAPKLARNAVTNPKIKAAAVTAGKLRDAAVTSGKLADQAVTPGKLADQAVMAAKLADASVTGGKLAAIVARVTEVSVANNAGNAANAACQSGERIIGGGVRIVATTADDVEITASRPIKDNGEDPANGETFTQWRGAAFNQSGSAKTLRVFALCLQ